MMIGGGLAGLAGIFEAAGPFGQMVPQFPTGYGFTAIIVAFLGRLHPIGIVILGGARPRRHLRRRRARAGLARAAERRHRGLPGDAALLPARHRHPDHPPDTCAGAPPREAHEWTRIWISVAMTVVGAATPLLLAALGELVVEKSRRAQPRRRGHDADRRRHRLRRHLDAPARRSSG